MTRNELLLLVQSICTGSTDDMIVSKNLDNIEEHFPHGDVCDLIFQDMRNLTPEQVVEEAIRREADYRKMKKI